MKRLAHGDERRGPALFLSAGPLAVLKARPAAALKARPAAVLKAGPAAALKANRECPAVFHPPAAQGASGTSGTGHLQSLRAGMWPVAEGMAVGRGSRDPRRVKFVFLERYHDRIPVSPKIGHVVSPNIKSRCTRTLPRAWTLTLRDDDSLLCIIDARSRQHRDPRARRFAASDPWVLARAEWALVRMVP